MITNSKSSNDTDKRDKQISLVEKRRTCHLRWASDWVYLLSWVWWRLPKWDVSRWLRCGDGGIITLYVTQILKLNGKIQNLIRGWALCCNYQKIFYKHWQPQSPVAMDGPVEGAYCVVALIQRRLGNLVPQLEEDILAKLYFHPSSNLLYIWIYLLHSLPNSLQSLFLSLFCSLSL